MCLSQRLEPVEKSIYLLLHFLQFGLQFRYSYSCIKLRFDLLLDITCCAIIDKIIKAMRERICYFFECFFNCYENGEISWISMLLLFHLNFPTAELWRPNLRLLYALMRLEQIRRRTSCHVFLSSISIYLCLSFSSTSWSSAYRYLYFVVQFRQPVVRIDL